MQKFNQTDLVKLKSGGPIMVITHTNKVTDKNKDIQTVHQCTWYNGSIYVEHTFDDRMLVGAFEQPQAIMNNVDVPHGFYSLQSTL